MIREGHFGREVRGTEPLVSKCVGRVTGRSPSHLPVSKSARAAVTKYHRLGSLNSKHSFLTVLEAGSPKSSLDDRSHVW